MNKLLTVRQLTNIYPFKYNFILDIISRGEFAPYRPDSKRIKILYCDETKKLFEHFAEIKMKKRGRRCKV